MEWAVRVDVVRASLGITDARADTDAGGRTRNKAHGNTHFFAGLEVPNVNRRRWPTLEHLVSLTSRLRSDGSDAAKEEAEGRADGETEQEADHDALSSGSSPSSRRRSTIWETRCFVMPRVLAVAY
jgi:hypothetical protein